MSTRDELLDKAIAEAKEAEDWQLVEWLHMARGGESAARWYSDKLREVHRAERKLLDENAKLREQIVQLQADNAKLRDIARRQHEIIITQYCPEYDSMRCKEECPLYHSKDDCEVTRIMDELEELEIEVDG